MKFIFISIVHSSRLMVYPLNYSIKTHCLFEIDPWMLDIDD